MLSRYTLFGGRREGERRNGLRVEGLYIDRYPSSLFLLLISLYALNLLDATYTLLQIANGGVELNPVANSLLSMGPRVFVLTKMLGVGMVLCFLCMHTNFRRARYVIAFGMGIYSILVAYHVVTYTFLG